MTNKIAQARIRMGYTQNFVAEQVGCTQTNISHIELGRQSVTPALAKKLAELLSVDVVEILYPEMD